MTQKEIVKTIKRINERMAVYQRQGLTDSIKYQRMVKKIELLDIPYSNTKGRFKISMKKSDLIKIDPENLKILDSMPSLKQERKQAKELGYKTTKEQNEYIQNRGSFEKWMDDNAKFIYNDAQFGNVGAEKLKNLFKERGKGKGLRNTDYDTIWKLIDEYERIREREKRLLTDSEFKIDDKFNTDDKF